MSMVAHTVFPDEAGTLTAEQDGVLMGAWGRPENPGKWVWASCRAYHQQGLPAVMECLLKRYEGRSYQEMQHDLQILEKSMTPHQFWAAVGHQACQADAKSGSEKMQKDCSPDERSIFVDAGCTHSTYTSHGMRSWEALELTKRIKRDGKIYHISAQVEPLPGGRYQVVMHQRIRGHSIRIPQAMVCILNDIVHLFHFHCRARLYYLPPSCHT
jgi:hypothetical protein